MNIDKRDFSRGFLPAQDPLLTLPEPFAEWESAAADLSKLLLTDYLRPTLRGLPPFPLEQLHNEREYWRAAGMLSYMATLYILGAGLDQPPAERLPAVLAQPLVAVADYLHIPPILSYAVQTMYNWRRIRPDKPTAVGNLTLIQNFLGGIDEEWFVTLHINIEAEAGRALKVLLPLQAAVQEQDHTIIEHHLQEIAATLGTMQALLQRMPERCDPYIYYHRVRPFMFGWKDNPHMPNGLIYEGVDRFQNRPQQFRGETGAQSGVIPAIDAALGVTHEFDSMRAYLMEMRDYMPLPDRQFVQQLEQGPSVRTYIAQQKSTAPALREAYNEALVALETFRRTHIEFAAMYILKPAQGDKAGEVGTGGTPFTVYLKKHIKETAAHLL